MVKSERSLNFVKALEFTLPWECGRKKDGSLDDIVHYYDKALPTKYGIWQGANPDLDVPNLTLDEAIEVYKDRYWLCYLHKKPVYANLDSVEIGLAVALFDTGVNVGEGRAWGWCRQSLQDKDPTKGLLAQRGVHYAKLKATGDPNYTKNFNGWMRRLNDLKKYVDVLRASHH
jgi:hypothetical protein